MYKNEISFICSSTTVVKLLDLILIRLMATSSYLSCSYIFTSGATTCIHKHKDKSEEQSPIDRHGIQAQTVSYYPAGLAEMFTDIDEGGPLE